MDLGLGGRAAIVTGASRGIGRGVAEALAAEGARVLLCGRDTEALELVAKAIGSNAQPMTVDILVPSAAEASRRASLDEVSIRPSASGDTGG